MKKMSVVIAEFGGDGYPWKVGDALLFIGEITNMPGHCVVVDKQGKTYWGYHDDNFRKPTEDEL